MNVIHHLVHLTLFDPRAAARKIMELNLALPMAAAVFGLSLIFSVLVGTGLSSVVAEPAATDLPPGTPNIILMETGPLGSLLVAAVIAAVMTVSFYVVGYALGGTAKFAHVVAATAWADIFSTVLSLLVMLIALVVPVVGGVLVIAISIIMVRISILFLATVHNFETVGRPIVAFILALFIAGFILSNVALVTGFLKVEMVS